MYRQTLKPRDRGGAIAAVTAIHAGLLFVFLNLSGTINVVSSQNVTRVFDVTEVPPPEPEPEPPVVEEKPKEKQKPEEEEGGRPENVRSEATPIVAPKPRVVLPVKPPVAVTQTPRQGAAPTQGAGDRPGPGTGAGGTGTGTGTGSGSGAGGGGEGIATRAQLLTGSLRSRDFPRETRGLLSQGRSPFVMFTVLPNGRVSNCRIYQSSGDPRLDDIMCALVTSRFVYRPAYNRRGEPVASQMAYRQGN